MFDYNDLWCFLGLFTLLFGKKVNFFENSDSFSFESKESFHHLLSITKTHWIFNPTFDIDRIVWKVSICHLPGSKEDLTLALLSILIELFTYRLRIFFSTKKQRRFIEL
jgi:hypothetical protein